MGCSEHVFCSCDTYLDHRSIEIDTTAIIRPSFLIVVIQLLGPEVFGSPTLWTMKSPAR